MISSASELNLNPDQRNKLAVETIGWTNVYFILTSFKNYNILENSFKITYFKNKNKQLSPTLNLQFLIITVLNKVEYLFMILCNYLVQFFMQVLYP